MYCKNCGTKIDADSNFCVNCGKSVRGSNLAGTTVENKIQEKYKQIFPEKHLDKYDLSYPKNMEAVFAGSGIMALSIFLYINSGRKMDNDEMTLMFFINLIIRISVPFWVVSISRKLNRQPVIWGVFAFLFPAPTLIFIGLSKKIKDVQAPQTAQTFTYDDSIYKSINELSSQIKITDPTTVLILSEENSKLETYIFEYDFYTEFHEKLLPLYAALELTKRGVILNDKIRLYLDEYAKMIGSKNFNDLLNSLKN